MLAPNSSHRLEGLSTEDAIRLLLMTSGYKDTKANRELARAIVEELGHLPLALVQAGGYTFVHKCLSTYLMLHRRSTKRLLSARLSELPYQYPSSVAATIQMSLDRLPMHAFNILQLFSHLDSTSIPHIIIERAAKRKFRRVEGTKEHDLSMQTREQAEALIKIFCVDGEWSEVDFNDLIMRCLQYSLLRVTTQGSNNFYSMHILVQSYLRAKVDLISGYRPGPLIVRLLGSSYSDNRKYFVFNRLLLPHLRQIRMEDVIEAGDHHAFGHAMESAGDNRSAVPHLERCVEIWRKSLGDQHKNTLAAMGNLALSYKEVWSLQEALELEKKVWDVQRQMLGEEHHDTLAAAGNLAVSYRRIRRHKEAMELGEQVLEAQMRVLGREDVHTVKTMANLALSYKNLGQNRKALEMEEQILEIQRRKLGPEDLDTLDTMRNLAESYRITGRKHEALKLNLQALEKQKGLVGDEHPDTLISIRIQLDILRDLGMREQLWDLLRLAVPAHEKALGKDHPRTLHLRKEFEAELALL